MTYNRRQRGTAQPPLGAGLWPLSEALPKGPALWAGIFTELCMLGNVVWWRWPDLRILAIAQGPIPKQAGPRARIRPHYQSTGQGDQLRSGRPDHRHAVRTLRHHPSNI